MTRHLTTVRNAAVALVAVASLAACGSADTAGNKASDVASKGADAASTAAAQASTAASEAGAAASSAASQAGSSASSAASSAASQASTNATDAASAAAGTYTLAQVAEHKTAESCWAAIKAPGETATNVYDLTKWIAQHPGGPKRIENLCGTDATQAFAEQHGEDGPQGEPEQRLATFKIGTLKG